MRGREAHALRRRRDDPRVSVSIRHDARWLPTREEMPAGLRALHPSRPGGCAAISLHLSEVPSPWPTWLTVEVDR